MHKVNYHRRARSEVEEQDLLVLLLSIDNPRPLKHPLILPLYLISPLQHLTKDFLEDSAAYLAMHRHNPDYLAKHHKTLTIWQLMLIPSITNSTLMLVI